MVGNFQDDDREDAMRNLFQLYKDDKEGRSGVDAFLDIDDGEEPFELKTTSNGSVTTVRDFGPDHIKKWKYKHWLIGFFVGGREYYKYGSPSMMAGWISEKELYISPDFKLSAIVSEKLNIDDMHKILEPKVKYSIKDAQSIQKRQYKKTKYLDLQDVDKGYSPERMLEIVKDRATYLVERGSTLNNPHIPLSYFEGWEEITDNHAERLRVLVKEYLKEIS